MKQEPMVKEAALNELRASLRGGVLSPTDAGYEELRRVVDPTNVFHLNQNVRPTV